MRYGVDDITVLDDAWGRIRRLPEMYGRAFHDAPSAVALLVDCALRRSAEPVTVGASDGWHWVHSDDDWLSGPADRDVFTEIVPFPEAGVNSMRPEVVVAARAAALVTLMDGVSRVVVGDASDLPQGIPLSGGVIAFRLR